MGSAPTPGSKESVVVAMRGPLVNLDYILVAAIATLIRYIYAVSGPFGLANGSPAITLCSSFRSAQSSRRRSPKMLFRLARRTDPGSGCVLPRP